MAKMASALAPATADEPWWSFLLLVLAWRRSLFCALKKKWLFEKQRWQRRGWETCWFTPQMSVTAGGGPDKAKNPGFQLGLPCGWQGPFYLSYHLLYSQAHEQETGSEAEYQGLQQAFRYGMWASMQWLNLLQHDTHLFLFYTLKSLCEKIKIVSVWLLALLKLLQMNIPQKDGTFFCRITCTFIQSYFLSVSGHCAVHRR